MGKDKFFAAAKTRKRPSKPFHKSQNKSKPATPIHSDNDAFDEESDLDREQVESSEAEDTETVQQKRIRLAKKYIDAIDAVNDSEEDKPDVAKMLARDAKELKGTLYRPVERVTPKWLYSWHAHKQAVTCTGITSEAVYSADKQGMLIRWNMLTGKKEGFIKFQHAIACMAVSACGQYIALGHQKQILILKKDAAGPTVALPILKTCGFFPYALRQTFSNHRDHVSGLVFQNAHSGVSGTSATTCALYSASLDRSIKIYDIETLAYVETLFGHQDVISSIDSIGYKQRCVTTGSRDRTVRLWKIIEESQLVFRGGQVKSVKSFPAFPETLESSGLMVAEHLESLKQDLRRDSTGTLDCVAMVNDEKWVTGSDGGTLSIWSIHKKKPLASILNAHGRSINDSGVKQGKIIYDASRLASIADSIQNEDASSDPLVKQLSGRDDAVVSDPNWITSVAALPFSNIVATGSWDGFVRLWKIRADHISESTSGNPNLSDDEEEGKKGKRGGVLQQIAAVPVEGLINSLVFSNDGKYLAVGVGREPRMGRWHCISGSKNGVHLLDLSPVFTNPQ